MSLQITQIVRVDVKGIQAAIRRFSLAPKEMRKALRFGAQKAINPVRTKMRKIWRSQHYLRGGPMLHRKAIAAAVRTVVKVRGDTVTAAVGIKRSGQPMSVIVNVLEHGFRHKASGKRINGRYVRAQLVPLAQKQALTMAEHAVIGAKRAIAGRA